jgi:Raf kinase inhibitor-like YbhB/YbcL family protein
MTRQSVHRHIPAAAAVLAALVLFVAAAAHGEARMELSSSSIVGGQIAQAHACRGKGGKDQAPQLTVRGLPAEARYISIVADDPDAMKPAGKVWVHWNVFNVAAQGEASVAAGQKLAGDEGQTSGGRHGYEGMCPPDGVHTYRFAVFASREKLAVDPRTPWTIDAFEARYGAQVLAKAQISGRF